MINEIKICAVSMVTKENMQRVNLTYSSEKVIHLRLSVLAGEKTILADAPVVLDSGTGRTAVLIPRQSQSRKTKWTFRTESGDTVYETEYFLEKPLERTMYIMVSSHTDIGLHNAQYIQRYNSAAFIDQAAALCDETQDEDAYNQYRYTMEGTWFWNNYGADRGKQAADRIVKEYVNRGRMGICCGVAGNHIQTYGLEEMCRSTYEKRKLLSKWGIDCKTMTMIDNNGLPMSMIQAFSEAGYQNIIFSPNQWNPLESSVWTMDRKYVSCRWSPEANGGGARIDFRYTSALPMLFYWEDAQKNRILVWGGLQYDGGGSEFGIYHSEEFNLFTLPLMEQRMSDKLPLLDEKYPYSVWLMACYGDDEPPNKNILQKVQAWNRKWQWPKLKIMGNPDEPFEMLRRFNEKEIPVIRGDITGGWYQHPVSAPELLAQKFEADRCLPTAEKWAVIASLTDKDYRYPATDFSRAWDYLLYNDEHSYGTSGYQGRRVYETWMQHRDWISKSRTIAEENLNDALTVIASKIACDDNKTVVFNPTLQRRCEHVVCNQSYARVEVPALGYKAVSWDDFQPLNAKQPACQAPPVVENAFYKVRFSNNGAIFSIYDKALGKELLDAENPYKANELVYTDNNHKTFYVPDKAQFEVSENEIEIAVLVKTVHERLGAELKSKIVLPKHEKRIDFENNISHARSMINKERYYRYIYFAFPFMVEHAKRYCHLNGAVAEYGKDVTGHGTDVYMAVHEWCCSENENFGTALMMLDSQLVEFDHIHPDKTDFANPGAGAQMYVYCANDWLQMHCAGGSHLNYQFRFSVVSYSGGYKAAGIPEKAEMYTNPVHIVSVGKQAGVYPEEKSFMTALNAPRLLTLKPAENGSGIIARFYGNCADLEIKDLAGIPVKAERVSVDEEPIETTKNIGFVTYLLGKSQISTALKKETEYKHDMQKPAPIGAVHTGLITKPCAACGEDDGQLYLLWGYNTEENFSHYKLYRGEQAGFEANEQSFVADIAPEEYVVGRYVDNGLKTHTRYYYRVCAVNSDGICGELSEEFSAYTKEIT